MQIRFPSPEARTRFIATLEREDRYLFSHVKALYSQPNVAVAMGLEGTAPDRLRTLLAAAMGEAAIIYGDAQFETFS